MLTSDLQVTSEMKCMTTTTCLFRVTKPTKEFHMKVDADVSYSYQPDKKTYNFEVQRANGDLLLTGAVKKNDQLYYSHDVKLEKSGKFHFGLTRDYRSYDLNLDNLYRPTSGNGVLKVKDRVYTMKLTREPLKFTDITVEGNAAAYIKQVSFVFYFCFPKSNF